MKYVILNEEDLKQVCDFYDLEFSEFQKYGGAILYEDGTLYYYDTYYWPNPVCDHPGLLEDYLYFIEHGYIPEA